MHRCIILKKKKLCFNFYTLSNNLKSNIICKQYEYFCKIVF